MCQSEVKLSEQTFIMKHIKEHVVTIKQTLLYNLFTNLKILIFLNDWTSISYIAFLSVINYYFTEDWKYQQQLLTFQSIHEQHTDLNLTKKIKIILNFYSIFKCLFAVTTNNAVNNRIITKALNNIITRFKNAYHISYFTYVIQLVVKMLLKHVVIKAENDEEEK